MDPNDLVSLIPDLIQDAPWLVSCIRAANQTNVIESRKKKKKTRNSKRTLVLTSQPTQKPPPRAPQGMGEPVRYWMGIGKAMRNEYGDYNSAHDSREVLTEESHGAAFIEEENRWIDSIELLALLLEVGGEHWITKDGHRILIGGTGRHAGKHVLIGAAPYRAHNVDSFEKVSSLFSEEKVQQFEKQIPETAKNYEGLSIDTVQEAAGVWQASREASFMIDARYQNESAMKAFAANLGETAPERQMATVAFVYDNKASGFAYELRGVKNHEEAIGVLLKHGFDGQTAPLGQDRIILLDENGSQRGNIIKASKELGLRYKSSRGQVNFITENNYAKIQSEYHKTKAENEAGFDYHPADVSQEGKGLILLEGSGVGLHWITINGNHIPMGNSTTAERFRNRSTGKWDTSREVVHQATVDKLLVGKTAPVGRRPIAYILGGGTASGKTTVSRALLADAPNTVRIDPDELKLAVQEYAGFKQADPENAAFLVHDESSQMTKMALAAVTARGLDLTYDSTTSGEKGVAFVHELAAKGYDVRGIFVDIPVNEAMRRAEKRALESKDPINLGRKVPENIIRGSHQGAANSFFQLKNDPALTSIELYDNQEKTAKLVYKRIAGGQEHIYDHQRFRKYSRKSVGLAEATKKVCTFERPRCFPDATGHRRLQPDAQRRESQDREGKTIPELILEIEQTLRSIGQSPLLLE